MLKMNEIKKGDYLIGDNLGDKITGEVIDIYRDARQVCIQSGTQDFWYGISQLSSIPLSEKALFDLKFHKQIKTDGTVKYGKGAFRLLIFKEGDFSKMEIWYRDEHRHIFEPIEVHELQNHFYSMTKVFLNETSFD